MEVSLHCEDCNKIAESSINVHETCEFCGHLVKENDTCPCVIAKLRGESAERIRALISLGHPNEEGEPYGRFDVMDECQRRGKQLFLDLGWPINPEAIYKNKYTGGEYTLKYELYHLCMDKEQQEPFDERLGNYGWSVLEHAWPKDKWVDTDLNNEYKSKLSYFKATHQDLSEPGEDEEDYEMEDGDDEMDELDEESGIQIRTIYDTDKVRRGPKIVDKTQTKLGVW